MTWSDAERAFAEHFSGYEPRVPQRQLAERIEAALAAEEPIMAEAPTGTGKSFAALVPAIDYARLMHKPVCAATGTKNLQDQYIRDLTDLTDIYLPDLKWVVIKGRSNYVCRAKVADLHKGDEPFNMDLDQIMDEAEGEAQGDLDRLSFAVPPMERAQLTISAEECPGKNACPFAATCFAERVKEKAKDADVVIANHALVAIDAVLKTQNVTMLPDFAAVIIDEAHEFEGYMSNALSTKITEAAVTRLASQVGEFCHDRALIGEMNIAAKLLFDKLRLIMTNRDEQRETQIAITPAVLLTLESELIGLLRQVSQMEGALAMAEAFTDEESLKRKRLRKRVASLEAKVRNVVMADFGDMVRWIEREEKKRYDGSTREVISLQQAPMEVGPFLAEALWPWQPVALVSATLAIGADFDYLASRLGLDAMAYRTFQCPSPFDYGEQAMIYTPNRMPDPVRERVEFQAAVAANVSELVRAADGRALLLFTSWEGLNAAYRALRPVIEGMGHQVFKQGDAPNKLLAERFKADEHSVLFAVKSFFTGVDIRGDSLRLLVIDKLPFPVPNVLFSAQCTAIDERVGNSFMLGSFMTRQVPEMNITLTQALGRLIRSTTDRGLAAILDSRLYSKPSYGRKTLGAIQVAFPAPVVTALPQATAYLRSLEEVKEA